MYNYNQTRKSKSTFFTHRFITILIIALLVMVALTGIFFFVILNVVLMHHLVQIIKKNAALAFADSAWFLYIYLIFMTFFSASILGFFLFRFTQPLLFKEK